MKVASKIVLVAFLALLPILVADTWFSLQREESLFRSDMERDLSLLGAHLRKAVSLEWRRSGAEGVTAFLAAVAEDDRRIGLEWSGGPIAERGLHEREDSLVWVEPVVIDGQTVGRIVLTEPLAPMHAYLHVTIMRLAVLTVVLIVAFLLSARLLGHRMIGRRLNRLVEFAAQTGSGRLGQRVDVGGHDEITRLGSELGEMSEALAQAHRDTELLNDERLAMLQELRHTDRLASLGRLAGSVAHELGTPLNVVLGHADRISEGVQAPHEMKESADTIHRQVKRMETTIRDILGFARQAPAAEEQIDLGTVVESVCGLLRPLAQRRGVALEIDGTLASAPVQGRVVQLEQALSNLVSNAIDVSPEDGQIVVGLSREERVPKTGGRRKTMIVARVRDQGPGIAEADLSRLFEPFFTSKAAGKGTGLGLWLAEGIVRDHGGSIEVHNQSEGGACFAMVLPESEES